MIGLTRCCDGTLGLVALQQEGEQGAAEEISAQNVAGPVGAEVYPGDADCQDQAGQEGLEGPAQPRPMDKHGGQMDEEGKEDEGLVGVPAGEAKTAKRIIEADQVGGWSGSIHEHL